MTNSRPLKIAVLPGDGIGQEVTLAAIPVFKALNLPVQLQFGDIGWRFWQEEGSALPSRTKQLIAASDVALLGAATSFPKEEASKAFPKQLRAEAGDYLSPIIELRQNLDLYAALRPFYSILPNQGNFDITLIRENTEGLYAGFDYFPTPEPCLNLIKKQERFQHLNPDEVSCSLRIQTKAGLERLFAFAFKRAKQGGKKRICFSDKPNVLRESGAFARRIFEREAAKYPEIHAEVLNVDAVALKLIRQPEAFELIVAENMFGDILSDVGAALMGGLGYAPSGNMGENFSYFEPVHGSAPKMAKDRANPCAMFLSISLLLEHCGFERDALFVKQAVKNIVQAGRYLSYDSGGNTALSILALVIIEEAVRLKQRGRA